MGVLCLLGVLVSFSGCAKFPPGGGAGPSRRLHFVIELAAPVNPNYVYIVAINDANDPTGALGGPIPVISRPWGNGFVAGKATHFVRYDGFQPSGGYALYRFTDLQNLLTWVLVGVPVNFVTPGPDDRFLDFEIDLSQIRRPPQDPMDIQFLQINILTMDRVPTNPNDPGEKIWDAFGDSRNPGSINDYITIDIRTDRVIRNSDFPNLEPQGDVREPSLDIIDWRIEVRTVP
jgi:hypothetical protein